MKRQGLLLFGFLLMRPASAHQLESFPGEIDRSQSPSVSEALESGTATPKREGLAIAYLAKGDYAKALESLDEPTQRQFPWMKEYLTRLIPLQTSFVRRDSERFSLFLPADQTFLSDYALPVLEQSSATMEKILGHRPKERIRVEIYPTQESFSAASTLSMETLERSGAIGICKFHRLMILSPRALPLGYRWLDALSHEYVHLIVNEMSGSKVDLWFHEGTARYFENAYRMDVPSFLTPEQKMKLKEALEKNELISFARMSPSMVYLKNQEEVSLAFSEVSYAVSQLIKKAGPTTFARFLKAAQRLPFKEAFNSVFNMSLEQFEWDWREALKTETWEKTKGALTDEIRFSRVEENALIGADVQGRVQLGDQMRRRNKPAAALIEYERALKDEPDNAVVLLKAAKTCLILEDPHTAVSYLKRATDKNPNYGTPYYELARLSGDREAVSLLMDYMAINPFDPRAHEALSEVWRRRGELPRSLRERAIYDDLMK